MISPMTPLLQIIQFLTNVSVFLLDAKAPAVDEIFFQYFITSINFRYFSKKSPI